MKFKTLRKIDFGLEYPYIFLTVFYNYRDSSALKIPTIQQHPKNVLFVELAEMGCTVLAYPVMRKLKSTYPESNLYFLLFRQIRRAWILSMLYLSRMYSRLIILQCSPWPGIL